MTNSALADVQAYLDYFCDSPVSPGYAILIDAPWGAGKTYFLRRYLEARHAKAKALEPLIGPTFFWASLYGVKSLEEVREQFFAQAHPNLASPVTRLIGSGPGRHPEETHRHRNRQG